MAYNYLDLVNEACRRLNEVELSQDNFTSVKGFQSHIKDAVNSAIRDINYTHYEWPFNHSLVEETLTPGVTRYPFPVDAAFVNPETFRIKEDATPEEAEKSLSRMIRQPSRIGAASKKEMHKHISTHPGSGIKEPLI